MEIDSPAADALDAWHRRLREQPLGERVGAAFLLSITQDAIGYLATRGATTTAPRLREHATRPATTWPLACSTARSTLPRRSRRTRAPSSRSWSARDLDFSSVYALQRRLSNEYACVTASWAEQTLLARLPDDASVRELMRPFASLLDNGDVTELVINRPQRVLTERILAGTLFDYRDLDFERLMSFAVAIATLTNQEVSAENPVLSALLPGDARIQM